MEVKGFEIPRGFKLMNRVPLDAWSGPYSGNTIEEAIDIALSSIPIEIRYKSMQVRILTESYGSIIYWFKNGINNYDFEPMNIADTVLQTSIDTERDLRISGDTVLQSSIDTERDLRISGDTSLNNLITGETFNRISGDTLLNDLITNETYNRTSEDNRLNNLITGETFDRTLEDNRLNNLITGETFNRISGDTLLNNLITGETFNRISGDTSLNNLITGETFNRISGDTLLNDLITNETYNRISEDNRLNNLITGETFNRYFEDNRLNNIITGETFNRIENYNILSNNFIQHSDNTSLHLTERENILLDNISTGITFTEINKLEGITDNIQTQLNSKSNIGHTHSSLYHPTGSTEIIYINSVGDVHIDGNIFQNGELYETHAEKVYSKNDYIILRDEATTSLSNGQYTGIEAVKYDGVNNGRLVFDNTGTARVGDVGFEQPLATRGESSGMTNNGYLYWDSASNTIKTGSLTTYNLSNNYYTQSAANLAFVNVSGDTMTGGLNITSGGFHVTGVTTGETIMSTSGGVVTLKGINTGDQDLSDLATYSYVNNTFSPTGHTHDATYVNVTGDVMTGSLTTTSFIKSGGTSSQFLKADGSSDSTAYLTSASTLDASKLSGAIPVAVTQTEWDSAYSETSTATNLNTASKIVKRDASGNFSAGAITSSGGINITAGGFHVTGVTTGETIMSTSGGVVVLKGINTGDQDLSNLATYVYVNSTFSNVNHEHDSRYVNITGDTISGALLINNEIDDVVFAISGSTGQLLNAIDMQSGSLLQVNNESAIPILQVDSSGYIAEHSNNMVNIYASTVLFEFDKFEGKAAFVNYYVFNPATKAFKAGTLITAWDSINDNITFVNNKTSDIPGGSTEGISIESVIVDSHVQIKAIITDGRWEVDLSVKLI